LRLNKLSLWAPVVGQMALIFGISGLSNPAPLMPNGLSDKAGHFIGYALLSVLLMRALSGGRSAGITWRTALLAILFATLYGASDEIHQSFVPGRTPDVHDLMADALGGCAGAALGGALRAVTATRKSGPSSLA
jgi:VanZ family protein